MKVLRVHKSNTNVNYQIILIVLFDSNTYFNNNILI